MMLEALGALVQEVALAADLEQALAILVGKVRRAMQVDACTVLLLEDGGYVLRATDGLNPSAVGQVRIANGRGLVGLIGERREPVSVPDARKHPAFVRTALAREGRMRAFLGVPIIGHTRLIGVLTVQRRVAKPFDEEQEAFLITAAAAVAGTLDRTTRERSVESRAFGTAPRALLQGAPASPGVAVGTLVAAPHYEDLGVVPDHEVLDPDDEERALRRAIAEVVTAIRARGEEMARLLPAETQEIFEAHALIAADDLLAERAIARIRGGKWAPAALRDTIDELAAELTATEDEYLRERAVDVRAVGREILMRLQSRSRPPRNYPRRSLLIGEDIGLDWLGEVPRERLAGIVCLGGSATSHLSIVARGLGIPAVTGLGTLPLGSLDGRTAAVDGDRGQLVLDPSPSTRREIRRAERDRRTLVAELDELHDEPAITRDGVELPLQVNVGLLRDHSVYQHAGASGVGLFRTEVEFAMRAGFPSEDEQYRSYRRLLEEFAPRPVTIRTLDIGGDKDLAYFPIADEDNPVLGWRGIRVMLRHPEILLPQLRAMLRADVGLGNLRVLLPMIIDVAEVREARALLGRAVSGLRHAGLDVHVPPLGAMIEVPGTVALIPHLARKLDFFAVGTNDLTQYMLAVDRDNARVATLYDSLHPGVLLAIRDALASARRQGRPIGVCGEMAGRPEGALLLLAMGADYLSMAAAKVPFVKWTLRNVTLVDARAVLERALAAPDAATVHTIVREALHERGLERVLPD